MTALHAPEAPAAPTVPVMRPWLGQEEADAAAAAVLSGWVAQGPKVAEFEQAFARLVGASHAVAVSSCTTALHLALHVHGIGPGDDVVVPSLSFVATTNAVRYAGAQPVFADVDPVTANVTVETVAAAVTPGTKAVVVVHQGGTPADVDPINIFCRDRGIVVVEDSACAAGSTYRGRPVGHGSAISAWSFHPRKLLTTGEGGMITVEDPALATRLRRLREHGMSVSAADRHLAVGPVREEYLELGFNYRMTDIQAAVGLVQASKLPAMVARRRELAQGYQLAFADVDGVRAVADPSWGTSNFQSFWIEVGPGSHASRDEVLASLAASGISARHGIMAAHRQPVYRDLPRGPLPVTERLTDTTLILPVFHAMSSVEHDRVVDGVTRAVAG